MSKTTITVLYCVLIAVLIGVLIWGIGSSGWGFGFSGSFAGARLEPAAHYEVDASSVEALRLSLTSEDLRVEATDGDRIIVDQTANRELAERDKIRCGTQGATLLIESGKARTSGCVGSWDLFSTVTIQIPRDAILTADLSGLSGTVDVGDLEFAQFSVSTSSGSVDLTDVKAGELGVETLSGEISVLGSECETLSCETASGSVSAQARVKGEASLETLSGSQSFDGSCETFKGDSASGEIYARLEGAAEAETDSMSGNTELEFPDASRLRQVKANTASGSVAVSLPANSSVDLDFDSGSGQMRMDEAGGIQLGGSGAIRLEVETLSGDLVISAV